MGGVCFFGFFGRVQFRVWFLPAPLMPVFACVLLLAVAYAIASIHIVCVCVSDPMKSSCSEVMML